MGSFRDHNQVQVKFAAVYSKFIYTLRENERTGHPGVGTGSACNCIFPYIPMPWTLLGIWSLPPRYPIIFPVPASLYHSLRAKCCLISVWGHVLILLLDALSAWGIGYGKVFSEDHALFVLGSSSKSMPRVSALVLIVWSKASCLGNDKWPVLSHPIPS